MSIIISDATSRFYIILLVLGALTNCSKTKPQVHEVQWFPSNEAVCTLKASFSSGHHYLWSNGTNDTMTTVHRPGKYWVQYLSENRTHIDSFVVKANWKLVEISTEFGNMLLWLYPETPKHRDAFLDLVSTKYFDQHTFNRVVDGFVIQGGCPDLPNGFEDTSLFVAPEFRKHLRHEFGAVGGGRDLNPGKKTNACQFYIVDSTAKPLDRLNMEYTIFGKVIHNKGVVQRISQVPVDSTDTPLKEVTFSASVITLHHEELQSQYGFTPTYSVP